MAPPSSTVQSDGAPVQTTLACLGEGLLGSGVQVSILRWREGKTESRGTIRILSLPREISLLYISPHPNLCVLEDLGKGKERKPRSGSCYHQPEETVPITSVLQRTNSLWVSAVISLDGLGKPVTLESVWVCWKFIFCLGSGHEVLLASSSTVLERTKRSVGRDMTHPRHTKGERAAQARTSALAPRPLGIKDQWGRKRWVRPECP